MKSGSKLYDCLKWGKQFKKKMSLNKHRITKHHEDLPDVKTFSCDHCGKLFLDSRNLKQHVLVHTGEKPFVCDVCSKAFSTPANLKVHSTIHTGETRFKCSVCSQGFRQLILLKNHMLKKHEMEYKPPSPPTLQTPVEHHSVPYIPFVRTVSQLDNLSDSLVSNGSGSQVSVSSGLDNLIDSKSPTMSTIPQLEFMKPPSMSTIPCAKETLPFSGEVDNEERCKDEVNANSKPETSSLDECILKRKSDIEVKVEEDSDHGEDENYKEVLKEECLDSFDFLVNFEEGVDHVHNVTYNDLKIPEEAVAHEVKTSEEEKIFLKEECLDYSEDDVETNSTSKLHEIEPDIKPQKGKNKVKNHMGETVEVIKNHMRTSH